MLVSACCGKHGHTAWGGRVSALAGEESKDGGATAWFVCCGVGPVGRTVHSAARLCNAGLCCRRGCKRLTLLYVQRDSTCLKKTNNKHRQEKHTKKLRHLNVQK